MIVEKIDNTSKDIVFVYTTCPSREEAKYMGLSAINQKLAVCIDYWVIGSIYPWKGVIQDVEQYMLMITTEKDLAERLMKFIGSMHPYSTPMIARIDTASINPNFTFWIDNTLKSNEVYISEKEEEIKEIDGEEEGYHYGKLK